MYPLERDFGNGYGIIKVYADSIEGTYGEIYSTEEDVRIRFPDSDILEGFVVIETATGFIPDNCRDWNDTLKEAIKEYLDTIVPEIQKREEIERIKSINFLERTGTEQMMLYNYWQSVNTSERIWNYLGMSRTEYNLWTMGELSLNDGSYKTMENSFYKIKGKSLELARALLESDGEDIKHSLIYNELCDSINELNNNIVGIGPLFFDKINKYIFFFDVGEDLAAIVSEDACFHKEDFSVAMRDSGIIATEKNFQLIFAELIGIASKSKEKIALPDCVKRAINNVREGKLKESFDEKIEQAIDNAKYANSRAQNELVSRLL